MAALFSALTIVTARPWSLAGCPVTSPALAYCPACWPVTSPALAVVAGRSLLLAVVAGLLPGDEPGLLAVVAGRSLLLAVVAGRSLLLAVVAGRSLLLAVVAGR